VLTTTICKMNLSSSSVAELATPAPMQSSSSSDCDFDDAIRQALDEQGFRQDWGTKSWRVVQMDNGCVIYKLDDDETEIVTQSKEPLTMTGDAPSHSTEQQNCSQFLLSSTDEGEKPTKFLKISSQQSPGKPALANENAKKESLDEDSSSDKDEEEEKLAKKAEAKQAAVAKKAELSNDDFDFDDFDDEDEREPNHPVANAAPVDAKQGATKKS